MDSRNPSEPVADQKSDRTDPTEVVELAPAERVAVVGRPPQPRFGVKLIADNVASLTGETTSLLGTRLRAVTGLLLVVYSLVLLWTLINRSTGSFDTVDISRNLSILRLLILGGVLTLLTTKAEQSQQFLRSVEYGLFGALTLVWIFARYRQIVFDSQEGDTAALLVQGREAMTGLFMLMIIHGIFIPHDWRGTARVVLTMALAPACALLLFHTFHPQLTDQVGELLTLRNVSMEVLVVVVGAILATYSSHVLNTLRRDVHDARKFGQYQLLERIGVGGMGEVHLAEHMLMKRPCALKLIHAESARDPTALARFEREVKATASLTHPHTIDIYDYGHTDDGTFYYVMEYLPGQSLAELIADHGPLSPGRTIYLLRQAASALSESHAAGLVHRDLKPANLFVSERGGMCDFVKVLDFGLVKQTQDSGAEQLTADHVISGTPLYMAPEQAIGDRGLDARCDIYALGAIAYHMLTGQPPFDADNPVAVMLAQVSEEVVPPSQIRAEIPRDLEQVVMRCLAKKPADRYADALALEQALAACAAANEWNTVQAAQWWHQMCTKEAV